MSTLRSRIAVAAMLVVAAVGSLGAQSVTTGGITGTVTDPSNNPLANATIEIMNRATGAKSAGVSRENGKYTIVGLEVGSGFTVVAQASDIRTQGRV